MRIGIDVTKACHRDGIGTYTRQLVRALMDIDTVNQYRLYYLPNISSESDLKNIFERMSDNFMIQGDIDHATDEVDIFHSTAFRIPRRFKGKLVFTVHDLTFITHPEYHTLSNKIYCLRATTAAACYNAKFIAVSTHTKHDMIEYLGIPEEKIDVIYEAADKKFQPVCNDENNKYLSDKYGIQHPYIFNVGTIEPRKNIKRLLHAYSMLPEDIKATYSLVVAGGGGWLNSDIYSFVKESGLDNRIKFLGYVDDNDLPILYGSSDLFVYPSIYEGFGLPVLEAMSCGAPVIISQVSSLPEVTGDAAILIDPYDVNSIKVAIIKVLTDRDTNVELRVSGIKRSQYFSWEKTAEQTLTIYKRHS